MATVPPFVSAETLLRHPRFGEAVALLVDCLADLYGDEHRLVRSLLEYERAVTFMLAMQIASMKVTARSYSSRLRTSRWASP